jgi:hypothetical protein
VLRVVDLDDEAAGSLDAFQRWLLLLLLLLLLLSFQFCLALQSLFAKSFLQAIDY